MSPHENNIYKSIIGDLKHHVDTNTLIMSEELIKSAVNIVIYNIIKKYKDEEEVDKALARIEKNSVHFMALVVMQLVEFGKGENEGPFIDIINELLERKLEIV